MAVYTKAKPLPTSVTASPAYMYSTSDGRQYFPDILQDVYGEKAIVGFHRHGRTVRAVLIPLEAVFMLAGKGNQVDESTRKRIEGAAVALLDSQK